jgi:hypothetical protein
MREIDRDSRQAVAAQRRIGSLVTLPHFLAGSVVRAQPGELLFNPIHAV